MSTRQAWQRSITDDAGNLLTGVQVSVFLQDGITPATIYSGLTDAAMANPFNTGVQTVARFYAEPGLYVVRAFKAGVGTQEWVNVDISGWSVREDLQPASDILAQDITFRSPLWFDSTDPLFTVSAVMGSPVIEQNVIAPDGRRATKVTITAATRIRFDLLTGMDYTGELFAEIWGSRSLSNINEIQLEAYEVLGAGEKGWRATRPTVAAPLDTSVEQGGAVGIHYGPHSPMVAFGSSPSPSFKIAQFTLRVQPNNAANPATFYVYRVGLSAPKRKSRLSIVFDDGWLSVATLGAAPLLSRGLPFSVAVIPSLVDDASPAYMTKAQLRALVDSGCAMISHGPIGGTGSLIENYASSDDPIGDIKNDISTTVKWIKDNGLYTKGSDQCYIWPRGKFQFEVNDTDVIQAAYDVGIRHGRSTQNVTQPTLRGSFDAQSKYGRLAMPIIGHEAAALLANEPANIAAIISKIQTFSAAGSVDFSLMLHKVMRDEDATDSNRSITIRLGDLNLLAAAIKTEVDAGRLDCVLMQDFIKQP